MVKKMIQILAGLVIVMLLVVIAYYLYDQRKDRAELKKILENDAHNIVTYDSIVSASEQRLLDTIQNLREQLERFKEFQHYENTKNRRRNAELEKRVRDIDVSERPEF